MSKLISASIDLTKIDKSKIIEGKHGAKYYDITISLYDEKNKFGQDVAIIQAQSKQERDAGKEKTYLGNGKVFYDSAKVEEKESNHLERPKQTYSDDLPF